MDNYHGLLGLGAFEFFQSMPIKVLLSLDSFASSVSCDSGTILFRDEEIADNVIVLLSGRVKLYLGSSAKRIVFHVAERGGVLGLTSTITNRPHGCNAGAVSACRLLSIRGTDFNNVLADSPESWRVVARELARSYEQACARLRTVGTTQHNSAKLARLLLEWSKGVLQEAERIEIPVGMDQREIAECIGISREDVSRILGSFRRNEIIEQSCGILIIKNYVALQELADKDHRQSGLGGEHEAILDSCNAQDWNSDSKATAAIARSDPSFPVRSYTNSDLLS